MSDTNPPIPEDDDDAPLPELVSLREIPSAGFLGRVRRSISRKLLAGDLAELSWTGPFEVIIEFLAMIFSFLEPGNKASDDQESNE